MREDVLYPCNHVANGKINEGRMTFSHFAEVCESRERSESPFSYYMHARVSKLSTIVSMAN